MSTIVDYSYSSQTNEISLSLLLRQCSERNRDNSIFQVLSVSNKYGFIAQSDQFEDREVASEDTSNYKIVRKGMFTYNPARINVGSIALYEQEDKGIVSPMYVCFVAKPSLTPKYFKYYLSSQIFKHEMYKRLEGSVRLCLTFDSLCNIDIHLPCIDVQEKISKFFTSIETKAALEEKVKDCLFSQRSYLLQ